MSEGGEGPKNIVNLPSRQKYFSQKEDESLTEYKRRLTRYIAWLETTVQDFRKNVEDWTQQHQHWSSEVARLEGFRETGTPGTNWPLPQREGALRNARQRVADNFQRLNWYQDELKKAEVNLERYKQFRASLDLQSEYAKKEKEE